MKIMNSSSEHGFSSLLLAARDVTTLPLTYLSHIWLQRGGTRDPQYGLKMIISKSGPVLGLVKVQGGEELFAQICAPKKAHGPLEHLGKLREAGGQFSQKLPHACLLFHSPP
ncbi:hypothetical protein CHARACLAT_032888 [Characodon lateralis]|uniref:Uncharacterized protein n=1 Tax=Characodon lateralis TaxID=208331 RepID=A0ABU7DG70_9TELE|nr:hypothetical protein [Characodon lateralis]